MNIRLLLLILLLGLQAPLPAAEKATPTAVESAVQALITKTRGAFVFIEGGSGAVISPAGHIITNHHVIDRKDDENKVYDVRLGDGRSFKADLLGSDPQGDLAVLRIRDGTDLQHLPLGDSEALEIGELCLAIGNPLALGRLDLEPTFTLGVISALHQYRRGYNDAVVLDAPINPGNSGGPLINMSGEVVGINGMIQTVRGLKSNSGIGYAIPSDQIKIWLPRLKAAEGGTVAHGRLFGYELAEEAEGKAARVTVESIRPGSDAEDAGFRVGDVIKSVAGRPIFKNSRLQSVLGIFPAGTEVEAVIERDGEEQALRFVLDPLKRWTPSFKLKATQGQPLLEVINVEEESNPAKAGLQIGDKIAQVQDQSANPAIIAMYLARLFSGQHVKLTVLRQDGEQQVSTQIEFYAD